MKKLNKYFFEALKTRLENILRSLSGNRKSCIIWGSTTATDIVNTVVLTPRAEIVPGVPASLAELLVYYKACVAHEGAHIKYTSKKDWEEACSRGPAFQHLTNIIEDGRIEAAISRDLPGAGRWMRFANSYIYRNRATWGEGVAAFLMGLTAYAVGGRIPDVDPEIKRRIKLAAPWVDIGKASPNTAGVLTCVEEILKIPDIEELFRRETAPPPKDERASGRPQKSNPDQKTKDRAKKAREVLKERAEKRESPKEESGSEDADKSKENPKRKSGDKHKDDPEKEESTGDSKSDPKEDREDSGNPDDSGHEEESSGEVSDADDTNTGNPEEISDDPVGGDDKRSSDKSEGQSDVPSDSRKSSAKKGSPSDESGGDNADSATGGALEDFTSSEDGAGTPSGSPESPDGSLEDDYFDPPDKEDEDDFKNLLESSEREVVSITKDAENLENDARKIDPSEGITAVAAELHEYVVLDLIEVKKDLLSYQHMKEENQPIIKGLVNEIRVALESRKAYDLRGLNRGRLHASSLWKLAASDTRVFAKRQIPGDTPELAAYILVDLSGSMSRDAGGRKRIDHAKNAACVLSEACRALKIPHAITGFKELGHKTVLHYLAVTYDDLNSVGIAGFYEGGSNRDGYSIRVATNELALRPEPRKILFVLSDGLPAATERYSGPTAWQDVRNAVLEARKKGVRIVSLKFGNCNNEVEFKFMYDTPVFVHDTAMLPKALGSIFKRVLLE